MDGNLSDNLAVYLSASPTVSTYTYKGGPLSAVPIELEEVIRYSKRSRSSDTWSLMTRIEARIVLGIE